MHPVYLPKFFITLFFLFLLSNTVVPREIEDSGRTKSWGSTRCILCENGELHNYSELYPLGKQSHINECKVFSTVPLKSKLTLEAQNSRLDPRVSKFECFEFRNARIESLDARIESQVSMIED